MSSEYTGMSPKDLLRPNVEIAALAPFVDGTKIWNDIANTVPINSMTMSWKEDNLTDMTDPLLTNPALFTSSAETPYITISGVERKSDTLKGYHFGWKYDEDILQFPDLANEVERTRSRAGAWADWFWNNTVGSRVTNDYVVDDVAGGMTNIWGDGGTKEVIPYTGSEAGYYGNNGIINIDITGAQNWNNGASRDPMTDISYFKQIFKSQSTGGQAIFKAKLTDIYLPTNALFGLERFMSESKTKSQVWQKDPTTGGYKIPGMWDVNIHELDYSMYQLDGTEVIDCAVLVDNSQPTSVVDVYQALNERFAPVGKHWYLNAWEEDKDRSMHRNLFTRFVPAVRAPQSIGIVKNIA